MEEHRSAIRLKETKEDWINDITNTDDIELIEEYTKHYLVILNELKKLSELDKIYKGEKIEKHLIDNNLNETEDDSITDNEESSEIKDDIYILRRKLVGGEGFKEFDKKTIFVPESIIRRQGLEHGEKFKYIKDGLSEGRDSFENIKPVDKYESIEDNEIESYEFAVVDYDYEDESYVCKKAYENGVLKSISKLLINDNDVDKFSVRVDDVVSIAHFPNRNIGRIRWLYDTEEIKAISEVKKHSFYKTKEESPTQYFNEKLFLNLTIAIVGANSFINNYIEEVEKRGGFVKHTDSDVYTNVENIVKQSDVVVVPITQTSHAKMKIARDASDKWGRPVVYLQNSGRNHFVNEVENVI
ncbi:DUF2325 domain-containing protein [Staphylococcus xylosus]|uniref:DUF2325 domain-containing protein n=1 Tax=Staphylococcus xylosus TaxID=1288 RepID=UPI0011CCBC8D|nr:DUF2325 domain-containing protein [Staphylococcus xylosus]